MTTSLPPDDQAVLMDASAAISPMDLLAGQEYLSLEPRGLVVNLARLDGSARLAAFVNKVFQGGYYLRGINYKNFHALLYDFESIRDARPQAVLAAGLAPLGLARKMLYQGELMLNSHEAQYDFTYRVDTRMTFASGVKAPSGQEAPRALDEFVAVMWNKGVRFGLDLAAVEQGLAVAKNVYLRLTIAKAQAPEPGSDARVETLISLKKDLRPLESAEGQVDLRRYLCVFPQARAQQMILRKVPAQAGRDGHTVFGDVIPTAAGQDLPLRQLAGPGTAVATVNGAECLLAEQAGFVSVHPKTGAISVTDEVINHTPVGIKTGSLTLEVERCLQFGGVNTGYTLEANALVCKGGAIEGQVLSHNGAVRIEGNVVGGQVTAENGDIQVKGLVQMGSRLEAYRGRVIADLAENCLIVAREVVVRRAMNATIIAQEATIGDCQGASIFAYSLLIDRVRSGAASHAQRGSGSGGTTLAVPIAEPPRRPLAIIEHTITEAVAPLPGLVAQAEKIASHPDVQQYLRAFKAYQLAKSEEEAQRQFQVLQPLETRIKPVVDKWRAMLAEQQRLRALQASLEQDAQVWREKIRQLENELQDSMRLEVRAMDGDVVSLRLYKDTRLPLNFGQAAELSPTHRRQFEALAHQMATEVMAGNAKELVLTLGEPFKVSYRDLMAMLANAPDRRAQQMAQTDQRPKPTDSRRCEARLTLLEASDLQAYLANKSKTPYQRLVLPVKVDSILDAYLNDLTGVGAGILLSRQQRYLPFFKVGEKASLAFIVGQLTLDLELVVADVRPIGQLLRVGGYFVNLPPAQQAMLYKIKNALEARLHVQNQAS